MRKNDTEVYLTTLTNTKYLPGVKALVRCLSKIGSTHPLIVLIPENKKGEMGGISDPRIIIEYIPFDQRITNVVCDINNQSFPHWNETFFKLQAAKCTQFSKIILIDSDMMIMENIDQLFNFSSYSAAVGGQSRVPEWNTLNSGLMVIEPSLDLFERLVSCILPAVTRRKNDGLGCGDQDVFQEAFPDWREHSELCIHERYNVFWKYYEYYHKKYPKEKPAVLHFVGAEKPWMLSNIRLFKIIAKLIASGELTKAFYFIKYRLYCRG